MTEERCECCELPRSSCGKAAEQRQRHEAGRYRARMLALPGARAAEFPGYCSRCSVPFGPGEPIIRDPDGGWRNLLCCGP